VVKKVVSREMFMSRKKKQSDFNSVLSDEQINYGKKKYLLFSMFNGFSVALLAEGTLILFALKLQIPDYIVGVMSSFLFLGMPFIFVGKRMAMKMGVVKTISIAWFLRSVSILAAVIAPFVIYNCSVNLGFILFVLGAFGFYAFRGVGTIGWNPILGEITTEKNKGSYSAKNFILFTSAYFLSVLSLVVLFEFYNSIGTFQVIVCSGCLFGFCAAYNVSKVPESNIPIKSASVSIRESISLIRTSKECMKLIYIQTIYFAGIALTFPYSMLALKEGYAVKDYAAMSYILILLAGGIIISMVSNKIIDKMGPQKILISLYSLMVIASFMWFLAPTNFNWMYSGIIFLFIGCAQMGGYIALITYFLIITKPDQRIGYTVVLTIISSFLAGAVGALFGGGLLKLLECFHLKELVMFHYFFFIVFVLLLACLFVILKLEKVNIIKVCLKLFRINLLCKFPHFVPTALNIIYNLPMVKTYVNNMLVKTKK